MIVSRLAIKFFNWKLEMLPNDDCQFSSLQQQPILPNLVRHDEAVSIRVWRFPGDVGFATRHLGNHWSAGFCRNVAETNPTAASHVTDAVARRHAVHANVIRTRALDGQGGLAVLCLPDLDATACGVRVVKKSVVT